MIASTQLILNTGILGLKAGYSRNGQDLAILFDDLSLTNHVLISATTIGGTMVTNGPDFPEWRGVELGTVRTYSITVEGDVYNIGNYLLDFTESLEFEGGGPMIAFLQTLTGLPQKQQTAESTPYRVRQEGSAVGLYAYPNPAAPIWPAALERAPTLRKGSPKRSGLIGAPVYTEFPVSWSYQFADVAPLVGNPNIWI